MRALFMPMDGQGHLNACLGIAQYFQAGNHEVIFALKPNWSSLVKPYGYKMVYYQVQGEDENEDHQRKNGLVSLGQLKRWREPFATDVPNIFEIFSKFIQSVNGQFEQIINTLKPDIILYDFYLAVPAIIKSHIFQVSIHSYNPETLYLSFKDDNELTEKQRELRRLKKESCEGHIQWLMQQGVTRELAESHNCSSFYNVYIYPTDLDYDEYNQLPTNYFRIEQAVRKDTRVKLNIDLSFVQENEKLIYFSLGSMGGADLELMDKLLSILGNSKHKFVVSKGPFPVKVHLKPNMVGDKYLNQICLLPHVDLVITHGGNNTVIESLYFGKPMIVLPLFGDQHSNGKRIETKGLGKCFNPYKVTQEELLNAIDIILENDKMIEKVTQVGKKIRRSKSGSNLILFLEQILENKEKDII